MSVEGETSDANTGEALPSSRLKARAYAAADGDAEGRFVVNGTCVNFAPDADAYEIAHTLNAADGSHTYEATSATEILARPRVATTRSAAALPAPPRPVDNRHERRAAAERARLRGEHGGE